MTCERFDTSNFETYVSTLGEEEGEGLLLLQPFAYKIFLVIDSCKPWEDSFHFALETCIKPCCQHIVFPVLHFTDSKSAQELSSCSTAAFESPLSDLICSCWTWKSASPKKG